jgi:hypothetical protein
MVWQGRKGGDRRIGSIDGLRRGGLAIPAYALGWQVELLRQRLLLLLVKLLLVGLLLVGGWKNWGGICAVRWGCEVSQIDVRGQLWRVRGWLAVVKGGDNWWLLAEGWEWPICPAARGPPEAVAIPPLEKGAPEMLLAWDAEEASWAAAANASTESGGGGGAGSRCSSIGTCCTIPARST